MNDEFEWINKLLDFYENLLTQKQRDVLHLYYREDYSLSEISEQYEITRSAVQDLIKRVIKSLKDYESKLELVEKFDKRSKLYSRLSTSDDAEVIEVMNKLIESE